MSRIDEIREREQASTKGPWAWTQFEDCCAVGIVLDENNIELNGYVDNEAGVEVEPIAPEVTSNPCDADFIAHSREDVPYLLGEVSRLKAENERLRAERDAAVNDILDAAITPCGYCKSDPSNGGNCDCRNEHHDMFACWKWRGSESDNG